MDIGRSHGALATETPWDEGKRESHNPTLGDVCQSLHQGLNTAGQKIKFHERGFPIIQTRNINDGVIDLEGKMVLGSF